MSLNKSLLKKLLLSVLTLNEWNQKQSKRTQSNRKYSDIIAVDKSTIMEIKC